MTYRVEACDLIHAALDLPISAINQVKCAQKIFMKFLKTMGVNQVSVNGVVTRGPPSSLTILL